MNLGQMMLVTGAIVLLGVLSLTVNRIVMSQGQTMMDTEASVDAVSIAQSMLDEMYSKGFDDATIAGPIFSASLLSSSNGPTSAESNNVSLPDTVFPHNSVAYYNDIGNYNGYSRWDTTARITGNWIVDANFSAISGLAVGKRVKGFYVIDSVYYVSEADGSTRSGTPTFLKKIAVRVSSPEMKKAMLITDIIVYRSYFN